MAYKSNIRRPRTYTSAERVIEYLSIRIMESGYTYKVIAEHTGLSQSTIRKVASRQTIWPRPNTFFSLLIFFNIKLELK